MNSLTGLRPLTKAEKATAMHSTSTHSGAQRGWYAIESSQE